MGYTFKFKDIEKICRALGMKPAKKGSQIWRGMGPDRVFRQTRIDSHGDGRAVATGTAGTMAKQLGFASVEDMYLFLQKLK